MSVISDERRNDIGTKIVLAIYSAGVTILVGLFVHAAWASAQKGEEKADKAMIEISDMKERVSKLEVYFIAYSQDIGEIKQLLKRGTPRHDIGEK